MKSELREECKNLLSFVYSFPSNMIRTPAQHTSHRTREHDDPEVTYTNVSALRAIMVSQRGPVSSVVPEAGHGDGIRHFLCETSIAGQKTDGIGRCEYQVAKSRDRRLIAEPPNWNEEAAMQKASHRILALQDMLPSWRSLLPADDPRRTSRS